MSYFDRIRNWFLRGAPGSSGLAVAAETEAMPEEPAFLIVGLGNPGAEYANTRHNIGFRVVQKLALQVAERAAGNASPVEAPISWREDRELDAVVCVVEIAGRVCWLIQPLTFMNRSGRTVSAVLDRFPSLDPAAELLVVYDDMDLPTGRLRLRPKGGAGGHRGMADILAAQETQAIARLRFGVGHPGAGGPAVIDWVLAPFAEEEHALLEESVARAANACEAVVADGVIEAMGQFNASG